LSETASQLSTTRTVIATTAAMVAFASNSILCRLALRPPEIDAVSFTVVRLVSGAATLLLISLISGRRRTASNRGDWSSGGALYVYAITFSLAYVSLDVGTGALILFALVQATMIVWGVFRGERPGPLQWIGLAVALGGLVYLVSPGLSAPSPIGSAMMAAAGVAWGVYSLRGRTAVDPIVSTTDNFVRSAPLAVVTAAVLFSRIDVSADGVALAIASGSLASGIGYVVWYTALRRLTTTRAATVQLTVPAIAAAGGVALLGESVSLRLVVSAALILGGVGLTLIGRERKSR
jgi:drug/metabolite transporter (DMT)-like permease